MKLGSYVFNPLCGYRRSPEITAHNIHGVPSGLCLLYYFIFSVEILLGCRATSTCTEIRVLSPGTGQTIKGTSITPNDSCEIGEHCFLPALKK